MEKFYVYQITNLINNKKYFGSTNNIKRRWKEHKSDSQNSNSPHYNYPLQLAFRKYGIENFKLEQLSKEFSTRYDAEEYEHELILKYDTVGHNGYNQIIETHNALTDGKIRQKLSNKIIAINIDNPNEKILYNSVSEAAKSVQTERKSISQCAKGEKRYSKVKNYIFRYVDENGNIIEPILTSEQVLKDYNEKNPVIDGKRHNIKEWCQIYGISTASFYKRIKKGYSIIDAITMPKKG